MYLSSPNHFVVGRVFERYANCWWVLHLVQNHRLVGKVHQRLGYTESERSEPCPEASHQNQSLHLAWAFAAAPKTVSVLVHQPQTHKKKNCNEIAHKISFLHVRIVLRSTVQKDRVRQTTSEQQENKKESSFADKDNFKRTQTKATQ